MSLKTKSATPAKTKSATPAKAKSASAAKTKSAAPAKAKSAAPATSLPAAAIEAFSGDATEALHLNKDDLRFFKGCVKKGQPSAPHPVARYLKLIRRLLVLKGPAASSKVVATVDLSQLPEEWASWKEPGQYGQTYVLRLMFDMVEQLLKSLGVKKESFFIGSGFVSFSIKTAQAARVLELVKLHETFIADGPLFLTKVPKAWAMYEPRTVENLEKALVEHKRR